MAIKTIAAAAGEITSAVGVTTPSASTVMERDANGDASVRNLTIAGPATIRGSVTYSRVAIDGVATALIANLGTFPFAAAADNGFIFIETSNAESAIAHIRGGIQTVSIVSAVQGTWGTTAGAANNFNVYWDSGTLTYRIENRIGAGRTFKVLAFGFIATQ